MHNSDAMTHASYDTETQHVVVLYTVPVKSVFVFFNLYKLLTLKIWTRETPETLLRNWVWEQQLFVTKAGNKRQKKAEDNMINSFSVMISADTYLNIFLNMKTNSWVIYLHFHWENITGCVWCIYTSNISPAVSLLFLFLSPLVSEDSIIVWSLALLISKCKIPYLSYICHVNDCTLVEPSKQTGHR